MRRRTRIPGTVGDLFKSRPRYIPEPIPHGPHDLRDVEEEIFAIEGIWVRFNNRDRGGQFGYYPFKRKLGANFALHTFHGRLAQFLPEQPYEVLDGFGDRVTCSNLTMSALRATYKRKSK